MGFGIVPRRRRVFTVLLAFGITVGGALASAGTSTGTSHVANASSGSRSVETVGPIPGHRPIAFPPVHVHRMELLVPSTVDPTGVYSSEPAPMGIGDFGVGQGGNPYTYSTTEFLGNFSWQHLNIQKDGDAYFSDQLNVVLKFVQSHITYAYWIQDVAFMDSSSNSLGFENNIWNMTTSSSCLNNTAVSGNGTVYPYSGCTGYYATGATTQPGASVTMPNPGDFGLLVRSYTSLSGTPEVAFEYWDGVTSYYVTYDNVVWPWATAVSSDDNFVVDGTQYNPGGWFYDAELAIGGPGGGSSTTAQDSTHITSSLEYWNGHNFEAPPSVWNFGANTAETVSNIQSIFSHNVAGLPLTLQLNGTTRNATPAQAYTQDRVGELAITATGVSQGTVAIPGDNWSFVGSAAALTLVPGAYYVWVNSTSAHNDLGICVVTAGSTTSVSVSNGCSPAVATPLPSPSSLDLGQSVTFQSSLVSPGSGGDIYAWHTSPSGLGCASSTSLTLSCLPNATGTYNVNVTVTDSVGQSSTSGTLTFIVHSDPTVGTPSSSRSTVETGEAVTFTAAPTGGALPYSYAWSGLPTPCSGTITATPTCTPSSPGSFTIQVNVTDASHYNVTSPTLSFSVQQGPSVLTPTAQPFGSVDLGQSVRFSVTVTGGSGGYTYIWQGLPTGCVSISAPDVTCTPTAIGLSSVGVQVNDSAGGVETSGSLAYSVDSQPYLGTLSATPATVDLGETLRFSTNAATSGGAAPYRYQWSGLPAGCTSVNADSLSCVPTAAGAGTAGLTVYDANNGTNSTTVPYDVYVDPSLLGISPDPASIDLGENVTFVATGISGGTGIFSYRWTGLPSGCATTNGPAVMCIPSAIGTSNVSVNLTDSNGFSVERSVAFTVSPSLSVGTPTASPGSGTVGQSVTFSVTVDGGRGPLTYVWADLPTGCVSTNASSLLCSLSRAGSFHITVNVTDSNGESRESGVLSFIITSAPLLGLPLFDWYVIFAALVGATVLSVTLISRRRRRRQKESSAHP